MSTETGGSFASARTVIQLYDDKEDIGQGIRLWLTRPGQVEDWRPEGAGSSSFSYVTLSGSCEVYLSHPGTGPAEFYVSRADSSAALAAVMRDIQQLSHQEKLFPLTSASVGLACLARYEDGVWYRGRVEAVSQDRSQVTVYYVDYGDTTTVPLPSLALIPPGLVTLLPAQAVHCRLAGVGQDQDLVQRWANIVTEKLSLQVEGVEAGVHVVQATTTPSPGINLNQELGRRAGRGVVGVGDVVEVVVTLVESTNSWYGQLVRSDVRDFLSRLSEEIRRASPLYRDSRSHKGQTCAVPDTRSKGGHRFLRGVIAREHKESVEVRLMDVGGKEKFYKNNVYCLPPEFSKRQEYGLICSFGCNPALTDHKFKDCMFNSLLEVRVLKKIGDGVEVMLTNTKSRKLKNSSVLSVLGLLSPDSSYEARLKSLYEKQNNKHNRALGSGSGGDTNGVGAQGGGAGVFERGDLRNSLREKRAARERQERAGLSQMSFKAGWRGECKITWMYSPAHFYIQLEGETHFQEMMTRLQEAMVTRRQEVCRVGQVVAARWGDGCWYRGQLLAVKLNKMEIFFVDFGNTEKIDKDCLAVLPAEFCQLQCQAVRVSLVGVEADWDKLDGKLAKFFERESFTVDILGQKDRDGAFPVQLNDGEIVAAMIKQKLVRQKDGSELRNGKKPKKERNEKETSSESENSSQSKKKDQTEKELTAESLSRNPSFTSDQNGTVSKAAKLRKAGKLFALGDFPGIASTEFVGRGGVTGLVSHSESAKHFWLQVQPGLAEDIKARLNTGEISELHGRLVKSIEVGECCLVSQDQMWYRATITDKLEGGTQVEALLVDWGLSVRCPLTQVRDGQFGLYDQPPAALRCRLDNKMTDLESQERKISVRFRSFKDNTFMVKVEKSRKEREQEEVVVVHVESVQKVWLVEKTKMAALEELMVSLGGTDPGPQENLSPGSLCCVRFSEDEELYRVRLVDCSDNMATVHYIDYGNTEEVETDRVLELAEELKELEPAARPVSVKFSSLALDSEKSRAKLEKVLSGQAKLSVSTDQAGEATFWSNNTKLEMTKTLGCVKDDSLHVFRISSSPRVVCRVSHVEGGKVWLKLPDLEVEQRLNSNLQERGRRLAKAGKVHVGDFVVARFSGDRRYYRARVVRMVGGHKVEVVYIDFGNRETVDVGWLKMLPGELRLCPGLATAWSLAVVSEEVRVELGEVRRVAGPDLVNSLVTADLAQPRTRLVSLWSGGARLELLTSTTTVSLPARLTPGTSWLGLLTNTNTVTAVINLQAAANISTLLEFFRTEIDVSRPVVGRVYSQTLAGGTRRRRIVVTDNSKSGLTISAVDTGNQTEEKADPSLPLETVTPRLVTASPSVITCSPNTRQRSLVSDKLVLVRLDTNNSIKMVELSLRVEPTFTSSSSQIEVKSQLSLRPEEENLLQVSLPSGVWTSSSLTEVREMLLQSALGLRVDPATNVVTKSAGLPSDLAETLGVTAKCEDVGKTSHSVIGDKLLSQFFKASALDVGDQEILIEAGKISVSTYRDLVPQQLSSSEDSFTVLELRDNRRAILQKKSSKTRFQVSDLKPAGERIEPGTIYLYKDEADDDGVVRVFVKKANAESSVADARGIDTGTTYLSHYSELYQMTEELGKLPPALLVSRIVTDSQLCVGDSLRGTWETTDDKLELQLVI